MPKNGRVPWHRDSWSLSSDAPPSSVVHAGLRLCVYFNLSRSLLYTVPIRSDDEDPSKCGKATIDECDELMEGCFLEVTIEDRRPDDCREVKEDKLDGYHNLMSCL
jgi:hypothetical protein